MSTWHSEGESKSFARLLEAAVKDVEALFGKSGVEPVTPEEEPEPAPPQTGNLIGPASEPPPEEPSAPQHAAPEDAPATQGQDVTP